jgi:hypothetical protein
MITIRDRSRRQPLASTLGVGVALGMLVTHEDVTTAALFPARRRPPGAKEYSPAGTVVRD